MRHDEVAVLARHRAQQLERQEARLAVHGVQPVGEPLLQFGACALGALDRIDLHDSHAPNLSPVRTSDGVQLRVVELGGRGRPIVVLHGLMGRAATWWPVARWLGDHGRVVGIDARSHGRSEARGPWTTQRLAADDRQLLGDDRPGGGVGHSMGGLHGLVAAAAGQRTWCGRSWWRTWASIRGSVRRASAARGSARCPALWPALAAVREGVRGTATT